MSTASDDEIANRPGTLRYTETPVNHPYFEHLVKRLEAVLTTIPGIGTRDHYVLAYMIVSYMIFVNVDLPDALDHDAESVQVAMLDVKDGFQFRVWCDTEHGEHVWVEGAPQPEKRAAFRIFWQTLSAVFGRRLESFMTA